MLWEGFWESQSSREFKELLTKIRKGYKNPFGIVTHSSRQLHCNTDLETYKEKTVTKEIACFPLAGYTEKN